MLYPKSISKKLGFDQILSKAKDHCETQMGTAIYRKIKFSNNADVLHIALHQTTEIQKIILKGELNVVLHLDFDIYEKMAQIQGFFYEIETLQHIQDLLVAIRKISLFFENHSVSYPLMADVFKNNLIDFSLIDSIESILGPDGAIKSSASPVLKKVISDIKKAESNIVRNSNRLFQNAKDQGFLADTELGIKNGRVVLPVLSEHKRKIHGVLIDQSGTGKVSYVEPIELVSLNNDLAELHIKRRQEEIVILRKITRHVVDNLSEIKQARHHLAYFDFVRSKARLAEDWRCVLPLFSDETLMIDCRHPLLEDRLSLEKQSIVPLNYSFNASQRLIIIPGPNAGGKSVALKTVGLLHLMLQHGFLIPCSPKSSIQLFQKIFIDIGDDQSIESDLSTYSSHLKSAKHIINFCDNNTLVLMDEIGTGTDPTFGGPMAEAILESVHAQNAFGIITTHFSNIKAKADQLKGVQNAAMLFDVENLKPQYELQIGHPGSSFVYEVATNIGLNKKLIQRAKELTDTKQYDLDQLLSDVQSQQEKIKEIELLLQEKLSNAARYENEYKSLKESIDTQRLSIINEAEQEAKRIVKAANKDIEKTIRIIKESSANQKKTKYARELLEKKVANYSPKTSEPFIVKTLFSVGMQVQIKNTHTSGEIVEINKNKVTIKFGAITTKTSLDQIEKVGQSSSKQVKKYISSSSYNQIQQNFKSEIDVRGMRTMDALVKVDHLIDSALIMGITTLRILHGKGNGILKSEIRKHIKLNSAIQSISYEHVDLGGEGISIIELK